MFPQVYRRDNESMQASTSTSSPLVSSPTPTTSSGGGPFSKGSSSSFFTFLVALLILVLASGALVVRAIYLRRRYRSQFQAAIDAGILNPRTPVAQTKPEMHEIYVRSLSNNAVEWENFLPVSAITLDEPNLLPENEKDSKPFPSPRLTVRQRLNNALRHPTLSSSPHRDNIPKEFYTTQPVDDFTTTHSRVQVAVLIAMPSEHPSIHPLYEDVDSEGYSKGKRRDSSLHDDSIPDVIFGISSLPLESRMHPDPSY